MIEPPFTSSPRSNIQEAICWHTGNLYLMPPQGCRQQPQPGHLLGPMRLTWRLRGGSIKKEHKRRAEAEQPAKPRHSDDESQNGCRAVHRCACQISTTHDWQLSGDVDIVSEQVGTTWCLTQSQCWIWWLCRRFSRQLIIQSCLKSEVKMKHSQIVKKMEHEVQMFGLMF